MKVTIADLIAKLQQQDQNKEVEFIVVEKDTSVVAMHLTSATCKQSKVLDGFHAI